MQWILEFLNERSDKGKTKYEISSSSETGTAALRHIRYRDCCSTSPLFHIILAPCPVLGNLGAARENGARKKGHWKLENEAQGEWGYG